MRLCLFGFVSDDFVSSTSLSPPKHKTPSRSSIPDSQSLCLILGHLRTARREPGFEEEKPKPRHQQHHGQHP